MLECGLVQEVDKDIGKQMNKIVLELSNFQV